MVPFRKTRATDYWACWDTSELAFYWSKDLENFYDVPSLVFHEMVHQWQTEYMFDHYEGLDLNSHDNYFFGWSDAAHRHGLVLWETM